MKIAYEAEEESVPDGSLVVIVDPKGAVVAMCKIDKGSCIDVTMQGLGTYDPTQEHTEFKFEIAAVPADTGKPQTIPTTKAKICRDKLGNVVKCPPR